MSTDDLSLPPAAQPKSALSLARLYYESQNEIAGSIHDGFVQYFVGAKMWLESIEEEPLTEDGKIAIKTILDALSDGVSEARRLICQLRHDTIPSEDLAQALNNRLMRYQSSVEHKVDFAIEGDFANFDDDLQVVVSGFMHDLINRLLEVNATLVALSAERRDAHLKIQLLTQEMVDPQRALDSLHTLMRAIGGELSIRSEPPGSALVAKFPIP